MADVTDIEEMVASARSFATQDGGIAIGIRIFDGVAELLVEVIRELRQINEKLDQRSKPDAQGA